VLAEDARRPLVECHHPTTARRFWFPDANLVRHLYHRLDNVKMSSFEVDVAPPQAEKFASA
jgi:hypothetical protein